MLNKNLKNVLKFFVFKSKHRNKVIIIINYCLHKSWQRPTLPCLKTKYHRR